jgi:hypothetical protein
MAEPQPRSSLKGSLIPIGRYSESVAEPSPSDQLIAIGASLAAIDTGKSAAMYYRWVALNRPTGRKCTDCPICDAE